MKKKTRQQIAALPLRRTRKGKVKVLLVTTRENRRWIPPKGWTMEGKKPWQAAAIEAQEEAGAFGSIGKQPVGTFRYTKKMGPEMRVRCEVDVYPLRVEKLKRNWPERGERRRKWFTLRRASKLVEEPELKALLKAMRKRKKGRKFEQEFRLAS